MMSEPTIAAPPVAAHCGQCRFFVEILGMNKGYCHGLPPTVFPSGALGEREVKVKRLACSVFEPLPDGAAPAVKQKSDPETPGDAIKQARTQRKFGK